MESAKLLGSGVGSPDHLRIIFLHHSTGRRLIQQGGVRQLFQEHNTQNGTTYEFWDHDYNRIGLTDAGGKRTHISFEIPDDNTNPDGLDALFSQQVHSPPDNALSWVLTFDVVIFKSCFPVSAIRTEEQLETYKAHYRSIRKTLAAHSEVLFIVMTPPPLIPLPIPAFLPAWTNLEDARRAREFALWLKSDEFLGDLPNVVTFDFFDELAESSELPTGANVLRTEYRGFLGLDSHPNAHANQNVAPVFVDFIFEAIKNYQQGAIGDRSVKPIDAARTTNPMAMNAKRK